MALASACFAAAVFSDPIPRGWTGYAPYGFTEVFGRVTSLSWSSDKGLLIAAILFAFGGGVGYVAAFRSRGDPVASSREC